MRALAIVVLIVACSAPQGAPSLSPTAVATPTAKVLAEKDTARYRTDCARAVLAAFIDAFNAGDTAATTSFFSANEGAPPFMWFYTPETPAYGPDINRLPATLDGWHDAGERWRLISVESGDGPSWHGGVDYVMTVERSWPDRKVTNTGKGALDCVTRKIGVFSLAGP